MKEQFYDKYSWDDHACSKLVYLKALFCEQYESSLTITISVAIFTSLKKKRKDFQRYRGYK
jgi:hypothetical protein